MWESRKSAKIHEAGVFLVLAFLSQAQGLGKIIMTLFPDIFSARKETKLFINTNNFCYKSRGTAADFDVADTKR